VWFVISFGQIATHSIWFPFFFGPIFYNVPKVGMCDVHLLWIHMKVWKPQSEKMHGIHAQVLSGVVQKGDICIKPQFCIMLLDRNGKCCLLGTPLVNNEILHQGCQPTSNKTSCRTLFMSKTPKLIETLKPCRTKSLGNKIFQCHYHGLVENLCVFLFSPLSCVNCFRPCSNS
jgi:hypothetical protein